MKTLNREIRNYFEEPLEVPLKETRLLETVQKSKAAFYEGEAETFLSKAEFLYQQGRYIRKCWWGIQGALLLVLWWILKYKESSFYLQRSMGIAAPLFVILVIPELWKNRSADAMEVECTTYYSLRQVYAARMLLFGIVDMLLLSLFFIAASCTTCLSPGEMLIQFLLPFNVTCCICFRMLYSKKMGSEIFALFLCMVWIFLWVQVVLNEGIYSMISIPVWWGFVLASLGYLLYCIRQGMRKWEETWEGTPLWN